MEKREMIIRGGDVPASIDYEDCAPLEERDEAFLKRTGVPMPLPSPPNKAALVKSAATPPASPNRSG